MFADITFVFMLMISHLIAFTSNFALSFVIKWVWVIKCMLCVGASTCMCNACHSLTVVAHWSMRRVCVGCSGHCNGRSCSVDDVHVFWGGCIGMVSC